MKSLIHLSAKYAVGSLLCISAIFGYGIESTRANEYLSIDTHPGNATQNVVFGTQPILSVRDQDGNIVESDNSTVVTATIFEGPEGAGLHGTTTVTAVNGIVTFTDLWLDTATEEFPIEPENSFYRLQFAIEGNEFGSISNDFTVAYSLEGMYIDTHPGNATQNVPFGTQPVLSIRDPFGEVIEGDNSTVVTATIFEGPEGAGLHGTTTVTAVNGIVTFTDLWLDTATEEFPIEPENSFYRLQFAIEGNEFGSISNDFTVAYSLEGMYIDTHPGNATQNVPFGTQPVLSIRDPFGEVIEGDNSTVVTATIFEGPEGAGLHGTTTVTAVNGIVTFTDLWLDTATEEFPIEPENSFYRLQFAIEGNEFGSISNDFTVAYSLEGMYIDTHPGNATQNVPFGTQPVLSIRDPFGEVIEGDNSTVVTATIFEGPEGAGLHGTTTVTAVNGIVTFTDLWLDTATEEFPIEPENSFYRLQFAIEGNEFGSISNDFTVAYAPPPELFCGRTMDDPYWATVFDNRGNGPTTFRARRGPALLIAGDFGDRFIGSHDGNCIIGGASADTLYGGNGPDTIFGNGGNDTIFGRSGVDEIEGGTGNDILNGGNDRDIIRGQDGNDDIRGGRGHNSLMGGNGNDTIRGSGDVDFIDGGNGNDFISGGNGDDTLFGGPGNDRINGGNGNDSINAGNGNDDIRAGNDVDYVSAGDGDDIVRGGNGDDTVNGDEGNDDIYGNTGNDTLYGDDNDDLLLGGPGDDIIEGGRGNDICHGQSGTNTLFECETTGRRR